MIRRHRNWIACLSTALLVAGCELGDTTLDEGMDARQDAGPDLQAHGDTALDGPGAPPSHPRSTTPGPR